MNPGKPVPLAVPMSLKSTRNRAKGFGLIELVVAMLIVTVLAVIAIPSYQRFVERSKRSVAVTALNELYTQQQQQRLTRRGGAAAAPSFAGLVGINAATVCVDGRGRYSTCPNEDAVYQLDLLTDADGNWEGIQATALGAQEKDKTCQRLVLNATGRQMAEDSEGEDSTEACWR